ncbi:winged helix-turn-helix domain-containing protein [Maribacter polysiphoniae]|uniref:winged helix-turn-helix domain-containing protein n=1 Tax=Maribacter polysiphoniae TaxID=429344 RepID=UPI0023536D4E|nr:crosslink repair DNA glycosylase YcaQ family protein [Maribacter polysiphoniae]
MTKSLEALTIQQARKLVLLSQRVPPIKHQGNALEATLNAIEHLGYIQIDTISAVQRAHHHTLYSRNPRYKTTHLETLMGQKRIFEYWSHAAAYLPMKDFRFSLPRKQAIATGKENHWYKRNERLMQSVLRRITDEGPLMARDFNHKGNKLGVWETKSAKQALENLYMQGELMVSSRNNFHKIYDLTERVLPEHVDTTMPGEVEYARFLITRFLGANGLGLASEIAYLLKNTKQQVRHTLEEMTLNGEVLQIMVNNTVYYALATSLELLNRPLGRSKLKILSPFDNLLIQRKRTKQLFGFDYLLECYVPGPKRKFGYFVLPILWKGRLMARMDCKADRKNSVLHIHSIFLEPELIDIEDFVSAFIKELAAFMQFNDCETIQLHTVSPTNLKTIFQKSIDQMVSLE